MVGEGGGRVVFCKERGLKGYVACLRVYISFCACPWSHSLKYLFASLRSEIRGICNVLLIITNSGNSSIKDLRQNTRTRDSQIFYSILHIFIVGTHFLNSYPNLKFWNYKRIYSQFPIIRAFMPKFPYIIPENLLTNSLIGIISPQPNTPSKSFIKNS